MTKLGVNLDHVATIRQQRYTPYPDMLTAIKISEESGADSITMHLREDRRHIQFDDIKIAREYIKTKLNLDKLVESIILQAEILDLKTDFDCKATAVVLESKIDVGRGPVATIIVTTGTLKKG